MQRWMFCGGSTPAEGIKALVALGFSAVVGNSEATLEAAAQSGLAYYQFTGAYKYKGAFEREEYLAVDVNGDRRHWFGSTCPTKEDVRARNIEDIRQMAMRPGIRGVLIDGARFSSPASADNIESFFTCFCDGCMQKAAGMGFDVSRMRRDVDALYRLCQGQGGAAAFASRHLYGVLDWLAFRRLATTEHIASFTSAVKSAGDGLVAGIYIFTPSLSNLVGQSYLELSPMLDLFSPMIYRHCHTPTGPACLDFEYGAILPALTNALGDAARARALLFALTGLAVPAQPVAEGFPVEAVYTETKAAAALVGRKRTWPIIMLDDDRLAQSIQACARAGAQGVTFFAWNAAHMETAVARGVFG